jgi:hypothetical protein
MWDGMTLIPGRECGACTVCCTAPSINKPEIQKLSGAACRHCVGGGCAVYDSRPPVCRAFYCAWRTVDIFGEDWRPDKSGVLAYVETEGISEDFDLATGIGLMLVGNPLKTVRQKWFQDFVVTGVTSSVPLNTEQMLDAIGRGAVKDGLEAALKILRGWDFQPAAITYTGNDVSTPG